MDIEKENWQGEGRYKLVCSNPYIGFIWVTNQGVIFESNATYCKMLGYSEDEVVNRHFKEFSHPEDLVKDMPYIMKLAKGEIDKYETEKRYLTKNGEVIWADLNLSNVRDQYGNILYRIAIIKEITERKKHEAKLLEISERLEKKNNELDQFAYIVSHDLKAPLRAVTNLSQWIKEDLGDNLSDENKKNVELMQSRIKRMEALITGILEYSKVGRETIAEEIVNVNFLLKEVVDLLSPSSKFTITIQSGMPSLTTEKILLQQVFSNLISNSIKYNDKTTGKIDISFIESEGFYEFSVLDNGPGIATEYHNKIFGIFQTLASRDTVESTGIGLSIVKKIVDEHNGKIWIESVIGNGAKFIFTWPKSK